MSVTLWIPGRDSEDDPNFSNTNFIRIMRLVGQNIDPNDLCGDFAGEALVALRDRTAEALAMVRSEPALDAGRAPRPVDTSDEDRCPAVAMLVAALGGNAIDGGLPEGYYDRRLSELLALCQRAIDSGASVTFG